MKNYAFIIVIGIIVSALSTLHVKTSSDLDGKNDVPRTCYLENNQINIFQNIGTIPYNLVII